MTFAERMAVHVRRLRSEDHSALRHFQATTFGSDAAQLDSTRHAWLFDDNPRVSASGPQFWIFEKNGEIAGQQAGIPFELTVDGKQHAASWAIDLRVRPEYRMRGVGAVLSEVYVKENDLTVAFGLTVDSYRAFQRAGWTDLGLVPVFVRPLRLVKMVEQRPTLRGAKRLCAVALQPLLAAGNAVNRVFRRGYGFERIDQFDERVESIWKSASTSYQILSTRNFESLQWRFDHPFVRDKYERFYLTRRGLPSGYAVLRSTDVHGVAAGEIVDFLVVPSELRALLAFCIEHFRRTEAAAVYCRATPRMMGPAAATGFLRRGSTVRLMVRIDPRSSVNRAAAADISNWFVTTADSDRDHALAIQPTKSPIA